MRLWVKWLQALLNKVQEHLKSWVKLFQLEGEHVLSVSMDVSGNIWEAIIRQSKNVKSQIDIEEPAQKRLAFFRGQLAGAPNK